MKMKKRKQKSSASHILLPFDGPWSPDTNDGRGEAICSAGVKATIVTTPRNVPLFSKMRGTNIDIQIIKFPAVEAGLPEGCENIDSVTSQQDMSDKFIKATKMLQQPLEQLLEEYQPSCLVADMFFPWATDVAAKFGIPRLVFEGFSFFSLYATHSLTLFEPHKKVFSDSEPFVFPSFPGEIKLTRMQLADFTLQEVETDFSKLFKEAIESELTSYGVVVNSFYELEPAYADHYRKLFEIAMGLEASKQQFIWVVRKGKNEKEEEDWLPKGFEKRMEGVALGVPMVTWPMAFEQFYNEKLITQVLKIGISVGAQQWTWVVDGIKREAIERALRQILVGEEVARAKALGEMARKVVEEGGSSYSDLNALIEELRLYCL
uniref:Uncharacterized protein n=1 Tax=Quercus lobata TaxID=97700 RepID=A0A7N2MYF0_QUELO